jgi:hypothetical protein
MTFGERSNCIEKKTDCAPFGDPTGRDVVAAEPEGDRG